MCLVLSHMFPHLLVVTDLQKSWEVPTHLYCFLQCFHDCHVPYQNANDMSSLGLEFGLACKVPHRSWIFCWLPITATSRPRLVWRARNAATHLVNLAVSVCILLGFHIFHKQLKDLMLKMMFKNCSDLEAADCALKTFTRDQPSSEGTGLVQAVPFGWLEASQHLADCASWLVQHTGRSLSKDKHLLVAFVANKLARSCSKLGVKWNQ